MSIFKIIFVLLIFTIFACKTNKPFLNKKEKIYYENYIHQKYNLVDIKNKKLNNISLYEISKSIKDSINNRLLSKRIDLFKKGFYSNKELQLMLKLDRRLAEKGWNIELNENSSLQYKKVRSLEEIESILKKIDSTMKHGIRFKQ